MTARRVCHCGHDEATHFRAPSGIVAACLAAFCPCKWYADDQGHRPGHVPHPSAVFPKINGDDSQRGAPHASPDCNCDACNQYRIRKWRGY